MRSSLPYQKVPPSGGRVPTQKGAKRTPICKGGLNVPSTTGVEKVYRKKGQPFGDPFWGTPRGGGGVPPILGGWVHDPLKKVII